MDYQTARRIARGVWNGTAYESKIRADPPGQMQTYVVDIYHPASAPSAEPIWTLRSLAENDALIARGAYWEGGTE